MSGPGRPELTRGGVFGAVLDLAAGVLTVSGAAAPPAAALTPPVAFTAGSLATYRTNGVVRSLAEANRVVKAGSTFTGVRPAVCPPALTAAQVAAHHDLADSPQGPWDTTVALAPTQDAYVGNVAANPSSDSTAGSADSHRPVPVSGAWTESAVTRNSRPSLAPTVLGTISGATAVSTGYSVELDAPALGGALGSAYSSALTSDGADSLRIRSGDVATAAHRPQLVLTFGAE